MLSVDELRKFKNETFTDLFINRVFEETQTYEKEMDFNGFLDFVLATENPSLPASINYLFKIFDFGNGYINEYVLQMFLVEIMSKLKANNIDTVPIDSAVNEVFDMAGVSDRQRITLKGIFD